ncbi:MAG: DUF3990 domain-containing protein [Bacteroidaceae bacterium]|nr:DUF3990 domain-containing protein [Bacteroidaceae bacterium]
MKVYHASSVIVEHPDTEHSRSFLDFGSGFYITTLEQQAIEYGQRFLRRGREAWLNVYELNDNLDEWQVLSFDAYDEAWLDFVSECRAGRTQGNWDIVRGGIANDKVFRTLDLYFSGDIGKQDALRRLVYEKPNYQLCFRTQQAIDQCLTYVESRKL